MMETKHLNMNHKYYNFKETLQGKSKLMTLAELELFKIKPELDYYVSIFKYNEEHKKKLEQTGSLSGITDVITDTLVWDFDNVNDPDKARLDAIELANRIVEKGADLNNVLFFSSGNKGFHVVLPLDRKITPEQFKKATAELANGLQTYDPSVNDPQRVLRMEYTKHPKTGLYKIPLSATDMDTLSFDEIKEKSKTDTVTIYMNSKATSLPEELFKVEEKKKATLMTEDSTQWDYKSPPKGWKVYKYALAQGHYEAGERHNALMVVAATCRGLGYDKDTTYYICKSSIKKQAARTGQPESDKAELYENIVESIFSNQWQGGQYSPQNNPWLKKYCERMKFDISKDNADFDKIVQLQDVELEFVDYVKNIEQNTILTGIKSLDECLPLTVGMNLGILGAASSGKTALALKILENTSESGVISVFASLDMRRNRLFEKLLYRLSGLSRAELYKRIKEGRATDIFQKVKEQYKNVYFYDRSCPTVEDIRAYIVKIEESTGKKVKLVMLDYFERVNGDKSDDTAASKEVSGKLQDLVNDLNICLITLVQPNKFSINGGPDTPLLSYTSIKGSGFLYQSFRSIISIWRPFFTPELKDNDKYLQMAILKNDLGELNKFNFGWDGRRGEIWELTEEGEDELNELITEKERKKSRTQDTSWD